MSKREIKERHLQPGDKVMLNIERITGYKTWSGMYPAYKDFVLSNKDTTFTIIYEPEYMDGDIPLYVVLSDNPIWLWTENDLILVEPKGELNATDQTQS